MNLKDFSLVAPVIQAGEVLKALEAAIPKEAIEEASPNGQAPLGHRADKQARVPHPLLASSPGSKSCDCHEPVVKGLDAICAEKPG